MANSTVHEVKASERTCWFCTYFTVVFQEFKSFASINKERVTFPFVMCQLTYFAARNASNFATHREAFIFRAPAKQVLALSRQGHSDFLNKYLVEN